MKVTEIISESRLDEAGGLPGFIKAVWDKIFASGVKGVAKEQLETFIKHNSELYGRALYDANKAGVRPPGLVDFLDNEAKLASRGKQGFVDLAPEFTEKGVLDAIDKGAREEATRLRSSASAPGNTPNSKDPAKDQMMTGNLKKRYEWWKANKGPVEKAIKGTLIANSLAEYAQPWDNYIYNMNLLEKEVASGQVPAGKVRADGTPYTSVEEYFSDQADQLLGRTIAKHCELIAATFIGGGIAGGIASKIPLLKKFLMNAGGPWFQNLEKTYGDYVVEWAIKSWLNEDPNAISLFNAAILNNMKLPNIGPTGVAAIDLVVTTMQYSMGAINQLIKKSFEGVLSLVTKDKPAPGQGSKQQPVASNPSVNATSSPAPVTPEPTASAAEPEAPVDKSSWKKEYNPDGTYYVVNPKTKQLERPY
jgi:hypothetical protein